MRRSEFRINEKEDIIKILERVEYGTLALCKNNMPYSIPLNFVFNDSTIYFHGSKKGKKIDFIRENSFASFSVVEPLSVIQSYFSSKDNLACPATHFFKSVICEGKIEFVEQYDEKVKALTFLMEKLQPEGFYETFDKEVYKKSINATQIFKLNIENMEGKLKLGQHLPKERFEMILEYLEKRGDELDKKTILEMKKYK